MAHLPTALTLAAASALALAAPRSSGPDQAGTEAPVAGVAAGPVRALDVLLFEDGTAEAALGGFRERRRVTDAPDVEEVTALFSGLEFEVDARAPIVDLGDGSEEAFERLAALRVDLEGAIGVVEMWSLDPLAYRPPAAAPASSSDASIDLPEIGLLTVAPRAARRGVAALLVAPPGTASAFALVRDIADPVYVERPALEGAEAPAPLMRSRDEVAEVVDGLPLVRIRRHELDLIRERLRARRVRGADGKTETIRVGPGPVEAHVLVSRGADGEANRD